MFWGACDLNIVLLNWYCITHLHSGALFSFTTHSDPSLQKVWSVKTWQGSSATIGPVWKVKNTRLRKDTWIYEFILQKMNRYDIMQNENTCFNLCTHTHNLSSAGCLSVCLSACLPACLSVCLSLSLSLCLSLFVFLSVCLSLFQSFYSPFKEAYIGLRHHCLLGFVRHMWQ